MTDIAVESNHLAPGQFFGTVPGKRAVGSSIISEVVHTAPRKLPEHSHELAFFSLLIDGSYSETYGRKSFSYKPFTVLWHPSGIAHKDEIGTKGGRFFSIEIRSSAIESLREIVEVPSDFHERGTPLVWLACRLYHEFRNWQSCSELVAEGLTLEMLGQSARKSGKLRKKPPAWLKLVTDRLDEEFRYGITTSDVAEEAGVHPVHLAATFRKFHGETIGEYVQSRRIEYACGALGDKDRPLSEIALDAGFSDQSHFTRVFRRFTGLTPGAFRESL